jgi:ABC-2 type transport system permease protein
MSTGSKILRTVVQKELRETLRDGRLWTAGLGVAALLLVAMVFGLQQQAALSRERRAAQVSADEHFATHDEKNPHEAAHYGTTVFKPAGLLRFIDPGVEPFVGSSVRLVAHSRNAPEGTPAGDAATLSRLGRLSVSAVLQLLVPLLVLVLGFSTWTSERERGTLRLLLSIGARPRTLFAGKLFGLSASVGLLLMPAVVMGGVAIAALAGSSAPAGRLVPMMLAYAAFLACYLFLAIGVSALARSSRAALVGVLALWVATTLVLPRIAGSAAALAAPVADEEAFERQVGEALATGLPDHGGREAWIDAITEKLLDDQGFSGAETLMDASLLAGIELQAEARYENEVLDHLHAKRAAQQEARESVVRWFSVAAPPVAVQSTSAALAGTDPAHHRHFAEAAERHRRALIDMLNRAFAESGGADGWSYQAGRETWARAPRFEYEQPSASWALRPQLVPLSSLGIWFVASLCFAAWASSRVRVG